MCFLLCVLSELCGASFPHGLFRDWRKQTWAPFQAGRVAQDKKRQKALDTGRGVAYISCAG
jgi:hypothetical protein